MKSVHTLQVTCSEKVQKIPQNLVKTVRPVITWPFGFFDLRIVVVMLYLNVDVLDGRLFRLVFLEI